jgi:nucleoside-diphosphate-sugar epimerase
VRDAVSSDDGEDLVNVFVAGGSGAIGVPLVRKLVADGHQVTALTRSTANASMLRGLGATPAIADALDAAALRGVVVSAHPTHVIHELTALPKGGPKSVADLEATNRLRSDGTRNLIAAAVAAGATRLVGGSFALMGASAAGVPPGVKAAADALSSMESQILEASRTGGLEGVVLRYGLFYGPENPSTVQLIGLVRRRFMPVIRGDQGLLPYIHVDDAARATIAALDQAPAGSSYDIVDNRAVSLSELVQTIAELAGGARQFVIPAWLLRLIVPYLARLIELRMPLSNAKARADLGWSLLFPTIREGLQQTLRHVT